MRGALALGLLGLATLAAAQTDHDNIDAGRPLRFDDAEPVALGTLAVEYGLGLGFPRRRAVGLDGSFEFIWGGALDTQFEVGVGPSVGGRAGDPRTHFLVGAVDLGVLHSFQRELRNAPALALKCEVSLPTERKGDAEFRLRGIATRAARQYDRFHLNLDADFAPGSDERRVRFGGTLGYTRPVGYPNEFNTTALAEVALYQGERRGSGVVLSAGLGVRRQISPRAVLDLGLQSDLAAGRRTDPTPLRLIAGYSTSF